MADRAWLESSLRRSASLGQEVLERPFRRRVDWTRTRASHTTSTTEEDAGLPVKKTRTDLDDVFETVAVLMRQMSSQCKGFYESERCADATGPERSHVSRFHSRQATWRAAAVRPTRERDAAPPERKKHTSARFQRRPSSPDEDFLIEVSPGTYAVTASLQESQQRQTQLVSVNAGESVLLTFAL